MTCISKMITTPLKVANTLEWRRCSSSLLNLGILRDRIVLAVAWHPSTGEPVLSLDSIPLQTTVDDDQKRRVLSAETVQELSAIVREFQVCGLVVGWPVRKGGWCGASCGRVLHTLDHIHNNDHVLRDVVVERPICLWDVQHHAPVEDEWGRAAVYSIPGTNVTTPDKAHVASKEQYHDTNVDPNLVAARIWNDFCQAHWPELFHQLQEQQQQEELYKY